MGHKIQTRPPHGTSFQHSSRRYTAPDKNNPIKQAHNNIDQRSQENTARASMLTAVTIKDWSWQDVVGNKTDDIKEVNKTLNSKLEAIYRGEETHNYTYNLRYEPLNSIDYSDQSL
jgi:cytidylate kinase